MIVGNSRLRRAVGFANGSLLSTTAGGGGGDPGGGGGTAFTYGQDETGATASSSAWSAKGTVVRPEQRLSITHMRGYFSAVVTGDWVIGRVNADTGEILEIIARKDDQVTLADAWTEVALDAPVTVYPDARYVILFDRTDGSGSTSSALSYVTGFATSRSVALTGWRNNNGDTVVGDLNESATGADWMIDWRGEYFDDPAPTIAAYDMVAIGNELDDFTFTYPAGIEDGDTLLLCLMDDDSTENSANYTPPTGYEQVLYFSNFSDSGVTLMLKNADGTESGSLTVALASGDNRSKVGFLLVIRGASSAGSGIVESATNSGSGNTLATANLVTTYANSLVIVAVAFDGADAGDMGNLNADYTILDQDQAGPGSVGVSGLLAHRNLATAGSAGAASFSSAASDGYSTIVMSFIPG